VMVLQEIDKL